MSLFLLAGVFCTAVIFAAWLALGRGLRREMKPTGGEEARRRDVRDDRPLFTGTNR